MRTTKRHAEPTPRSSRSSSRRTDQGGYVLPMFALTLTVLMAFAGLGVDVWNWWYNAQQLQRAADAGSLAGVVFMPHDLATARSTAFDVVGSNGYPSAQVTAVVGDRPNRLRVQVSQDVDNHFVSLLGIATTDISRDATAEFSGVVETGSPINQMGNQPIGTGDTNWAGSTTDTEATNPSVWAQIAGPGNHKGNGDRYAAGLCASGNFGCSGTTNTEYTSDGYFYTVRLTVDSSDLSKYLLLEVYDPAFVQSGDNCTQFFSSNDTSLRSSLASLGARYDSNTTANNNTYCTGDHQIESVTYGTGYPTVQFRTAGPDATPWNVRDNFSTSPISSCDGTQSATGGSTTPASRFRPYGSTGGESGNNFLSNVSNTSSYLYRVYHRWVRICAVSLSSLGITTPGEYDLSLNSSIVGAGAGHNRFAIRAGLGSTATATAADGAHVSVFANGPMPLYQNAQGSTAAFYLARVLPGSANRVLSIEFFDVGDGSGSGTIQILPPPDANISTFSGCTATLAPSGTPTIDSSCRLTGVSSATYNGRRVQVFAPIPNNYTCTSASATGCWVRVRFVWSSSIQDTTTWRASILGDPVRLTE